MRMASVLSVVLVALSLPVSAEEEKPLKDQIVGTWIYVSSTAKREDGTNVPRPSLRGAVTYTADGRFHFISTRTDLPKYASNDATKPSPEEAIAVASGVVAYAGTYTVDEKTKTILPVVEVATFPNLVGAPNQQRVVTSISATEMKFTNPRTSSGLTLEIVWKRAQNSQYGSADEAREMLAKAVTALRADKAKALKMFTEGESGFKDRDLYVACAGEDGKVTAHIDPTRIGMDRNSMQDPTGKFYGKEVQLLAAEGKVVEVTYLFPRPGADKTPIQKVAFVTKIADQICSVGYYK